LFLSFMFARSSSMLCYSFDGVWFGWLFGFHSLMLMVYIHGDGLHCIAHCFGQCLILSVGWDMPCRCKKTVEMLNCGTGCVTSCCLLAFATSDAPRGLPWPGSFKPDRWVPPSPVKWFLRCCVLLPVLVSQEHLHRHNNTAIFFGNHPALTTKKDHKHNRSNCNTTTASTAETTTGNN
jgi:hypothetical protein